MMIPISFKLIESLFLFSEVRSESDRIRREIEKVQAERNALLNRMSVTLPKPVPSNAMTSESRPCAEERRFIARRDDDEDGFSGMDNVLSSVLKAVDHGETAAKILPGAQSFEDIQKHLDMVKKEKLEKLKEKNSRNLGSLSSFRR